MEEAAAFAAPSIVSERLGFAKDLFNRGVDCSTAIRKLGNTASVTESVPSAIFCACTHQFSYKNAVVSAIRGGGDTDTIGSISGTICGARLGLDEIPPGWVAGLENSTGLLAAADGLFKSWQQTGAF
jgi:ADP-ribosylglycohydrolase